MKTKSKAAAYFDVPAMNQHAIASQFKEFRTEVADAIREKKGTTEPINPKDFAEEISTISDGNGGGGNYVYFDISGLSDGDKKSFFNVASLAKLRLYGGLSIIPMSLSLLTDSPTTSYLALAVDESAKILVNGKYATIGEMLYTGSGPALPPRITEEEFYRDPNVIEDGYFRVFSDYENTDVILQYDSGMTWRDWINSPYNLNPTTNKPYLKIQGEDMYWFYSDGWTGSMHNEYENDSPVEVDDLITNKTYYTVIIG